MLHKGCLPILNAGNHKISPREMEFYQKEFEHLFSFFIAIVTMHFSVYPYNIHQFSTLLPLKIGGKHTVHLERKNNNNNSIKYNLK